MELFTKLFGAWLLFVYHCFDRVVISGYLMGLQRPGQVVYWLQQVLGVEAITKEVLSKRTEDYVGWVQSYARNRRIPVEWAEKDVRKEDYVRPYLRRMERRGEFGVYFIFQTMEQGWTFRPGARLVSRKPGGPADYPILHRHRARYRYYYFYLRDEVLGPMILLPTRQCESQYSDELPAILAHELAHLKGGDLFWNAWLNALAIGLWFHPLAWRMRLAHADACDAVCDALASDYVGDAGIYGRTLARLTLRITEAGAAPGLAMARVSSVERRIAAVRRHVFRTGLSRRRAALTVSIATAAIAVLGGLAGGLFAMRTEVRGLEPGRFRLSPSTISMLAV